MNEAPRSPATDETVAAIVLAAGSSSRMGGIDKIWADLDGTPLVAHPLRAIAATPGVRIVVCVAPRERHAALGALLEGCGVTVRCVEGGARRQDSVAQGLAAVPEATLVLVHDGARALLTPDLVMRVLAAARAEGAAVPAIPVSDTIKRVRAEDGVEHVIETVDRAALRAVQTPQGFRADVLRRAHAEVTTDATDDASIVERLGLPVAVVPGDPTNLKVTTPADLAVARVLLAQRKGE